jgi:hypothetical protein
MLAGAHALSVLPMHSVLANIEAQACVVRMPALQRTHLNDSAHL